MNLYFGLRSRRGKVGEVNIYLNWKHIGIGLKKRDHLTLTKTHAMGYLLMLGPVRVLYISYEGNFSSQS